MIAAVVDTNVLVSGIGWRGSPPSRVVEEIVAGSFVPITSPALLAELRRVLEYRRLREAIAGSEGLIGLIEEASVVVDPPFKLSVLADAPDNRLLEAAVAAGADFLVTGDRELLELEHFEGTRIIKPRDFLEALTRIV